jgi:protein SCO1/2
MAAHRGDQAAGAADPTSPLSLHGFHPGLCDSLVLLALVGIALAGCGGGGGQSAATVNGTKAPKGLQGMIVTPGLPKPNFTLTDTSGQPFSLADKTQGYVTLLYFGYTHCPDVCPTHMANIATALRQVPASVSSRVKVVFVTTDPARDTGPVMRAWLDHFDPSFVGLTGTAAQIQEAESAAGEPPSSTSTPEAGTGNYGVDHGAQVDAFTTDNLDHVEYLAGHTASAWANDLPKLVAGWPK